MSTPPRPRGEGASTGRVVLVGGGPGAEDLLTVRAQRLVRSCGTCLYAGSIVPPEVLALCPPISRIINTARMPLAEIITELRDAEWAAAPEF